MSRGLIKERIVRVIRTLLMQSAAAVPRRPADQSEGTTMARSATGRHEMLRRYEEEIEQLRVENEHLRVSATTFGELAERLNKALKSAGGRGRTPIPGGG
jgi:hypothetical protein